MIARIVVLALVTVAGCYQDQLVACDDGRLCPVGTVCTANSCADQAAFDACAGATEGQACVTGDLPDGVCAQSVCVGRGCGNGTVDEGSSEVCDDGNTVAGDGCTSTCALEGCGNGEPDVGELCDDGNVVSHDGCSATCQREAPKWGTTDVSFDDERYGAAMAFVAARGHIVRFGGFDFNDGVRGGTFELVGGEWKRISTANVPSARGFAANAYDAGRQRWVLFSGSTLTADTWEFDGTNWIERAVSGPPAGEHVMAYDATGGRVVLYCGDLVTPETWTFEGTTWTKLAGASPSTRSRTAMAYDPVGSRIVLFGGESGGNDLADTWQLVGDTWSPVTTTGAIFARAGHGVVYDPAHGIVAHGPDDTWVLQGTTWTELVGTTPRFARYFSIAHDATTNQLVRYGGSTFNGFTYDDLFVLGPTGWARTPVGPGDRTAPSVATDTKRGRVIMFGGQSWSNGDLNDTWMFDATGWHELTPATVPSGGAAFCGMTYDAKRDRIVAIHFDETWEFDGTDWIQITSAVNTPFCGGPMVYEPDRSRVITIGFDRNFHSYDGTDWTVIGTTTGMGYGFLNDGFALTYDEERKRVLLWDEIDLWQLDGDTWVKRAVTPAPVTRWGAMMVYDPIRKRVVLAAGNSGDTGKQNDTWEWDGTAWTRLVTASSYSPREAPALAWLPSIASVVMFGGNDRDRSLQDTWTFSWTP